MAWYRAGTVALTNGNATVTGSGTAFIANAGIGEGFLGPDGRTYEITDIPSNTSLTISPAYLGSTASGQSYAILPARGRIADLIAETQSLLASFTTVRDGIGEGLFPDGSAAAPAFRFSVDQDTGIYRVGSNILGFATGGALRAVVTAGGGFAVGTLTDPGAGNIGLAAGGRVQFSSSAYMTPENNSTGAEISTPGGVIFRTGSGTPERVRIDGTGSVGIGTTSPDAKLSVAGSITLLQAGVTDRLLLTPNAVGTGSSILSVNQANNAYSQLILDGSQVVINSAGTERLRIESGGSVRPGADNTQNLGTASFRWGTVYAGTGTINTSDEREKHWRGELNAAELRAAKRIIGELGIYQWNDAVAEKGEDGARLHFGVRAQRAFAIMEDEGLDWSRYAWACYDQWEEQTEPVMEEVTVPKTRKVMRPSTLFDPATGQPAMVEVDEAYEETEMRPTGETRVTLEAGDRYGVRPDQLAFWLIAAQAAIQADLEARLAALEGA